MSLKLNSSGGGSVLLQEPTTASNRTLNLPDVSATVLTDSSGVLNIGSGQVYKDASGNVGIGATPVTILDIFRSQGNDNTLNTLRISNTTSPGDQYSVRLAMAKTAGGVPYGQVMGPKDVNGYLAFTSGSSDTERARIDSSGNLLVGTASASGQLTVVGSGTTSIFAKSSSTTNATYPIILRNSADTNLFFVRSDGFTSTGATTLSPYNNTTASAANMFVDSNGGLYRSTSSLKYKRDVQDATHGLSEVMQLRAVTYKGKSDADGETIHGGLIAEEVHEAGLTEFVQYAEDGTPDALAYGNMVSLCIKAIQEQQRMIEELKAKVAALEAK